MQLINEDLITTDIVPYFCRHGVTVYTLRTDNIHPVISGNKWFKLKYYLEYALHQGKKTIITFGGAYSNHIVATAAACKQAGLAAIGVIRGEEPSQWSHTLCDAKGHGMKLYFISRNDYKNKIIPDEIHQPGTLIIPEGGYGPLGAAGAGTINYDKEVFNTICCAAGTGTMMAGLINAKKADARILGISVLKNNAGLANEVQHLLIDKNDEINICHQYHFGGYAKHNCDLIHFMNTLYRHSGIPTDFVYSGKLFYAINDLIEQKYFTAGSRVLIIHCGGLQGNASLPKGTLIF